MEIKSFFREHWVITIIAVLVAAISLRLAYTKSELYYFRNCHALAYCERYPEGKYKARALNHIISSLRRDMRENGDLMFRVFFDGSEKKLSEFAQQYSTGEYRKQFEELCDYFYHRIEERYSETVSPTSLDEFQNLVEDKYHTDIERRKTRLEQLWKSESSAWDLVNELVNNDSFYLSDALDAINCYLEHYPRGLHAIDAYELKDELSSLEDADEEEVE